MIRKQKRYLLSDLTSGGQYTRLKGKQRKSIRKVVRSSHFDNHSYDYGSN